MVVVDYTATQLRNYFTTLTNWMSIGTSTTETISVTSTTINNVITTVSAQSITYPSVKKFTREYLVGANEANGEVLRRIAIKTIDGTSQVITLSNIPEIDKNNLIEISIEETLEVDNE